jgi:PAS domain S-box-containing protein
MASFLIFLVILGLSVGLLSSWRRNRKLVAQARSTTKVQVDERTHQLERANEDLKRDQEELRRRWQYLAEAQRLSHAGTFGWKVRSGELVWSDETYRILGITRETNPTLDLVFDRVHPDDVERVRLLSDRAAQNGMDLDLEHRILLPDGVVKYVQAVAHAGRDGSGNLEYMGVVTDITERKRADDEREALSRSLQESKARLEEAQSVAHVGYWDWDLETGEIIWSDETYRIFGFKPQERPMDIETVSGLIHPDDREALYSTVDEEVAIGVHPVHQHRIVRPNGEVRTVQSITSKLWKTTGVGPKDGISREHNRLFGTVQDITELKQAEEASHALSRDLQESKDWLEEAQRVAHLGYWVWDLETNQVIWSEETYRIFGLVPKGDSFDVSLVGEMMHPDDREAVFMTAKKAIDTGTRADCEHRLLRPDGEMRVVHSLGEVRKTSQGRIQMFGTTQDITDRKLAEQALRQSQFYLSEGERLAHIGSWASTDLGIRWSEDLNIYWSDEVYKIFGFDPKNGTPSLQQFLSAVHPQDQASLTATMKKMHEEHCGCDVTNRIVRPDGEIRYVRCVGIPVLEDGVFKGYRGTTMDVTEQELLTQELRREQAYLAEAQRLTHTGSWAANFVTGQNVHLSDETVRMHGFDPSEEAIPFERFFNTVHTEDQLAVRAALENATRTGTDYDIEYRICRADDGEIRFFRSLGHHHPSGEMADYVGTTMDITEQKHAEQERERLRQLEADLAHINRINMMGELAAALAHEIKQPIAASITSANALLRWLAHDPPDLERARAAATRIEQEGNRAADVINNLRGFYKKGAPAKRRIVDVKDIIREITVLLGDEALRHSVTIRSELDEHVPDILADRVQLQQVFMNLMLNAIEAMKETGGELTIRSGLNPEGQLFISISDTGVGLPAESSDRIFDAFHTTKPQGTGMGLAITRSILESHGGRIWATPNRGAGATFHFTLPVETEAHA